VAPDVLAELRAATVVHRDAREVAGKAAKRWRRAILSAIDAGMPQRVVADLAGVSTARVHAVVVRESAQA
jgi:hypothetical protein